MDADVITQFYRLGALHNGDNDRLLVVLICPLGFIDRRTAVQLIRDKITDWLRIIADDRKILAQVDTLNDIVHNERLRQKSAERTKSRLCIKHKNTKL